MSRSYAQRCPHGRVDRYECLECRRARGHIRPVFMPIVVSGRQPESAADEFQVRRAARRGELWARTLIARGGL